MNILEDDKQIKEMFDKPIEINYGFYDNLDRIKSSHLFDFGKKLVKEHNFDKITTDLIFYKNDIVALNLEYKYVTSISRKENEIPGMFSDKAPYLYTRLSNFPLPSISIIYDKTVVKLSPGHKIAATKGQLTPESFLKNLNSLLDNFCKNANCNISKEDFSKQFNAALDDLDRTYNQNF